MSTATADGPARNTRPRNRKQLIVEAAAALFVERGYPHVSMGDIAAEVAVGPSALYRHFPGKQELLAAVLLARCESFESHVHDAARASDPLSALAAAAIAHRDFGVLWAREARHLDQETHQGLARGVQAIVSAIGDIVAPLRPASTAPEGRLWAWVAVGVLVSPSFHHVTLPGARLEQLLAEMTAAAVGPRGPAMSAPVSGSAGNVADLSRREQLLRAAIALFSERGYQAVGIEEIAAAGGLTGTAIYRHFQTKNELLTAAMTRGGEWLRLDLDRALARTASPEAALGELVASYVGLVLDYPDLMGVLLTETGHLAGADQRRIRQIQRDYIAEWIQLLAAVHPNETEGELRCRVQAVFTMADTCARNPRLRADAEVGAHIASAAEAVLGLS